MIEFVDKLEQIFKMSINQQDMALSGYKILINEIMPRAKKCKMTIKEFIPSEIAHLIVRLEVLGITSRRDTRRFLELRIEDLKQ
jgi:hypothetical protein